MHHRFPKFSLDAAQALNLCRVIYMLYVTDHVSFSTNVAKYRMNNALYFNVNIYTFKTENREERCGKKEFQSLQTKSKELEAAR